MSQHEPDFDAEWERARGRLFPVVVPPSRADTEAFTRRVMARIPQAAAGWLPGRWLAPAFAFSAAALLLSFIVPAAENEPYFAAAAQVPAAVEDFLGFTSEDL